VFQGALTDPALFHALLLVLTFAENNNVDSVEVLSHLCNLLTVLRSNTQDSSWTPNISTVTAMLLLIGYECRTDNANSEIIATHMDGVRIMMKLCMDYGVILSDELQRALFWQDLISCLIGGSP
jgi:hypothetical protein